VGLAARANRGGRLAIGGLKSVSPRQGLEAFGRILLGDVAQICVLAVDWPESRAAHPVLAGMPFFSRQDAAMPRGHEMHALLAQLLAAPGGVQGEIVLERLRQHAAAVLRLAPAKVDVEQPLIMMGIDSLMAVELRSRIERELGVAIPLLQLIKGPSLAELTRTLIATMSGNAVPSRSEVRKDAPVETAAAPSPLLSFMSFRAALHESAPTTIRPVE
jgi:aryl carrier-like protein